MDRVCVTGAGGFIASWVIKLLLSKGYIVHGTVRDPCNEEKNGHLKKLENAKEKLHLFKTDLLNYEGLCAAFAGCDGVIHIASPVPGIVPSDDPQTEMLDPAILGTRNVLDACLEFKVKKVVVMSSATAVMFNPNWPSGLEMDESCWSDPEFCKANEKWYSLSKTLAEREAWEYAKKVGLNIVTICPSATLGPMLQQNINGSSFLLVSYVKDLEGRSSDETKKTEDVERAVVDVRDLADAILLLYEKQESEGRYICSSYSLMTRDFVAKVQSMFPHYDYPKNFTEPNKTESALFNSKKLLNLGWNYRPLEETISDSITNYEEAGVLDTKGIELEIKF
ncbi:hypothetical protein L2E82_11652 [Cichorium intybus]|uniref:Uncharacterized protein n=1 Tax=Cichorium intybus TaxID=13427 RepID=A0ACB9GEM1_CICIN|nr:hypothetical protein L2E82_11652 [Cichorium intybus]